MASEKAKQRIDLISAWCGIFYLTLLGVGWVLIARFMPPHSPSAGAGEILDIYIGNLSGIRVGMVVMMAAAALCAPFTAVLAKYIARIEGGPGVLTYAAIIGGACNIILTFYPPMFWLVAAYRPDRGAELIYLLNDFAWLSLLGGVSIFFPMLFAMVIAVFIDRSDRPTFPRWAGWAALWTFATVIPDQLIFFFHGGAFAWNGLFGFWVPVGTFAGWFIMCSTLLIKAVRRDLDSNEAGCA